MPSFRPSIVFAVFFLRDGTSMCTSLACFNQQIAEWRDDYTGGFLYEHSFVARALEERAVTNAFNACFEALLRSSYLGTESETTIWRREQASLLTLAAFRRENGIPFHLVLFPS